LKVLKLASTKAEGEGREKPGSQAGEDDCRQRLVGDEKWFVERANEEDERRRRLRVVGGPRSEQRTGWSLLPS
jgi:hypothetical protein